MLGLLLFGFILGVTYSAFYKTYSDREMAWNIIVAMVASLQGKLLMSLILLDGATIPTQIVLILWVFLVLTLKRLFLQPKQIKYLGE